MRIRIAGSATLGLLLFSGTAALAQAPDVGFSAIPFNFAPPGARALAMGGTFIGVADDATASASNPAGLIILSKPEFSAHGRFTKSGDLERRAGGGRLGERSFGSNVVSPSFFSVVVPRGNVAFSAYYQQVANFDTANETAGIVRVPELPSTDIRVGALSGVDLKLEDVGLSGAMKFEKFSIGASVVGRRMSLDYANVNTASVPELGIRFSDLAVVSDSDTTLAFNAGVLVNPNGRVSVGAVFKRGGEFEFPYDVGLDRQQFGSAAAACPPGTGSSACAAATVKVPDSFGVGVGFRPTETLLLSADATRVSYSQLGQTLLRREPFDLFPPVTNENPPADFDDVVELRGGAEYTFAGATPFSLRAGLFRRPDFNTGTADAGATFVTFGAGAVLGQHAQLDFAASLSDRVKEALVSLVYRF